MAARWAAVDRIRRPAGLKEITDSSGAPSGWREDLRADPPDVERYLGNGYLEAVARGVSPRAASGGARRPGNTEAVSSETHGQASTPWGALQAKLVVGAAGDAFEREADRVADELMRRADARALADGGPERPQREDAPVQVSRSTVRGVEKGIDLPPDIAAQLERPRKGGFPLPARERALFEPLLGVDLGSVRHPHGHWPPCRPRAL